ncbi:MAG: site-specific DNA-methyltransferase [Microvirga sp.]
MTTLAVIERPIASLKPYERNARTHSKKQIHQIAGSIDEFGFTSPVIIDHTDTIMAGHGRVEAARSLGWSDVPTIRIEHLTPDQIRAYILADNRIAQSAGWDPEILKKEFEHLCSIETSFDIEVTGFATAEIDLIIDGESKKATDDPADRLPEEGDNEPTVTRRGDLWLLGDHKLLCGDTRDPTTFARLMGKQKARLVFSDPPYNVKIDGHVCGLGSVKHEEFACASGEMSEEEFVAFLATAFRNQAEVSLDGAIHFQCMDWRHIGEMLKAGHSVYSELKNLCVWTKDNGGMGSFYRSQHELVFVWKVGTEPHVNTVELGKHGRYRTNVWSYAGVNTLKKGRMAELAMHPTVKPVAMIMDAIKDCSKRGEIVLDGFGGSGSTLIAAEKTKRKARLVEYEPRYVDVTVKRWEALTGKKATLADTGETFGSAAQRLGTSLPADGEAAA